SLAWQLSDLGLADRGGWTIVVPANPGHNAGAVITWPYMLQGWTVSIGPRLYLITDSNNGQTQYSTTYDSSTVAQHGKTTMIKTLTVDTGNQLATQSNVKASTDATFQATGDGGNILGTENIMIDGASMPTFASDRLLCPFGDEDHLGFPAYCNIAQAGSTYDLTIGSIATGADDRFVGTDATVPVALNYAINVRPYTVAGQGQTPALGSVSSTNKVSTKDRRANSNNLQLISPTDPYGYYLVNLGMNPNTSEDVTYAESSSASGIISSYNAAYHYQSGKAILP
ncbi:MAG: hypothetical protein NTV68_05665, partial [Methanomicrobiales archaeon]|nr:hypothetical protein [Methanomicrobiales archaeon]